MTPAPTPAHPLPEDLQALAAEIADSYADDEAVQCVLVIGSLTAGLGNAYSDLDLYVVSDDTHATVPTLVHGKTARVDIEHRPTGWLRRMVTEATDFTITTSELAQLLRSRAHFDTVGRLHYAIPLVDRGEFAEARSYLQDHLNGFRRFVMAREVSELHGVLEDCLGALDADDLPMAAQLSQEILRGAIQAFLVGSGSIYLGKKWISARLRSVATPSTPVDELLSLSTGNAGLADRDAVTARLLFAQTAVAAALTDGWDTPEAATWAAWPKLNDLDGGRAVDWMAVRVTDAIVLIRVRGKQLKLPEVALRVWGGHPHADVPEGAESLIDKFRSLGVFH
jgi:hypothetical protein